MLDAFVMIIKMKNKIEVGCPPNAIRRKEVPQKHPNIFIDILKDYCSTSTIHGIGYLGAKDKSIPEKIWWVLMILISMTTCAFLISKTWIKWTTNPVILSFEKEQIPIWKIPFPAVTVCPLNKVEQKRYNFTDVFRRRDYLSEEEYKEFWDIALICNLEQYYEEFNSTVNITDETAAQMIREVAPSLNDTLGGIKWQNKDQEQTIFAEQMTQDGLCYTFNSFGQKDMYTDELNHDIMYISHGIPVEDWNMEVGYSETGNKGPRRTAKDGSAAGFTFALFSYTYNTDFVCGAPISGYKVILHNPAETPKTAQQYFLVPLNRKVTMIVRPELTTTSTNLQSMSADIRKCYFAEERSLRFFKVYTQNNCRLECDANVTHHYCGCVPFYMPRDNETLVCGFSSMDCVREIETTIIDLEMEETSSNMTTEQRGKIEHVLQIMNNCQCRPACTSLHYTSETSYTEIHMVKSLMQSGIMEDQISSDTKESLDNGVLTASQVDIFFKESQFLALSRSELYGQTDFLANCGGLLGLFMGVSILSLLEIVYFLTIRLWFKYKSRRKYKM